MAEIVEKPISVTAKDIAKRVFRHENAVLATILLGIVAAMAIVTKGLTISLQNVINVMLQSSIRGVASIGQAFILLSGGVDLSVGGLGLMCAIFGASLLTLSYLNLVGNPLPIAITIPIVLSLGFGVGAVNGLIVSRLRVPALLVTFAMWQMTTGAAYQIGRGLSIGYLPEAVAFLGQGRIVGVPVPVIIFIGVSAVAYFILYHTAFGRSVYAVGGNPISAWLSGINTKNVRLSVFCISGVLAAITGIMAMSRTMSASMATLKGLELDTIAAVCIGGISLAGGTGTLIGVILGVTILGVISNGMNVLGLNPAAQDLVKGGVILTAVIIDYQRRR